MFIGEYKDGKRNGHAKVFANGKLILECEYVNNLINGKAKEFDSNGNLVFEGDYLNRK